MKLKRERIKTINLTLDEQKAIEIVYDLLNEIEKGYGTQNDLISINTGEVIHIGELPRIRGVLNGLLTNIAWTIQ